MALHTDKYRETEQMQEMDGEMEHMEITTLLWLLHLAWAFMGITEPN